jgi:Ca2+-binding EF-hand superfamily protein
MRASMNLDVARNALDAERKGQGSESDGSPRCGADLVDGDLSQFASESETRLREIRDHLAYVEELSSPPKSGSDLPQAVAKFHSAQRALRERHLEDAIELYDDAIACGHPNPAQCHNGAALCHSILGNHPAAQQRFALAVSADPQDVQIWHNNRSRESTPELAAATAGTPAQAGDPNRQLVQSEVSILPLAAAEAAGSMMDMFDPSGLQMSSSAARHAQAANSQISSLGEEKEDRLRDIFARADRNGDGNLTRSELILRLRKDTELAALLQLPQRVGDDERDVFEAVFQGMDQDDDRAITSEEFVAFFMSFKSEFERAATPDSRPSTAATSSDLLALADGNAEAEPQPERGGSDAVQTDSKSNRATPSSAGSSRPSSRERWQTLSFAVREPTYGEKTVFLGSIILSATGVRGFPRDPLPLNVMRDPDTVPEAGVWAARRCDGQLSIKVDSQSISDYADTVKAKRNFRGVAKGQLQAIKGFRDVTARAASQHKSQDCTIKIVVSRARALTPMWRADGDIDQPADTCSAFVSVRPVHVSVVVSLVRCKFMLVTCCLLLIMVCAQIRSRNRQGNVTTEVKCSPIEASLDPRWDEEMVLDVADVHDASLLELSVYDSRTGHLIGLVGIPVHYIHRNPQKRWIKLQDPDGGETSLAAGVVDAGDLNLDVCKFGVIEMEHSLKWKSGLTMRQRIIEVLADSLE